MSNACAPILVGVVSPLSKIPLLSKTAKFPFPTMDYSPWSSKNLIDRNRLKKFVQVGVDVRCMHTDFGGCGLTNFGDIATFNFGQNLPFGLWTTQISINSENLYKYMQMLHQNEHTPGTSRTMWVVN